MMLSFTAVNWNNPQNVVVTGIDDDAVDGDVPYTITIATVSSDQNYSLLAEALQAINIDNDTPGISLAPMAGLETSENGRRYVRSPPQYAAHGQCHHRTFDE